MGLRRGKSTSVHCQPSSMISSFGGVPPSDRVFKPSCSPVCRPCSPCCHAECNKIQSRFGVQAKEHLATAQNQGTLFAGFEECAMIQFLQVVLGSNALLWLHEYDTVCFQRSRWHSHCCIGMNSIYLWQTLCCSRRPMYTTQTSRASQAAACPVSAEHHLRVALLQPLPFL